METLPDPSNVTSWPQAVVFCVLILAVLVVPSVMTYLGNKATKAVQDTLTKNNGGSTVRDALDRIEGKVDGLTDRVSALEGEEVPSDA